MPEVTRAQPHVGSPPLKGGRSIDRHKHNERRNKGAKNKGGCRLQEAPQQRSQQSIRPWPLTSTGTYKSQRTGAKKARTARRSTTSVVALGRAEEALVAAKVLEELFWAADAARQVDERPCATQVGARGNDRPEEVRS